MKHISAFKIIIGAAAIFGLSACAGTMERLNNVGKDPAMSKIENPTKVSGYQPISMPMPAPRTEVQQANSLWLSGRKSFFKDQRAGQVGDILTVVVDIRDNAKLETKSEKTKNANEDMGVPNLFGIQSKVAKIFPGDVDPASFIETASKTKNTGKGKIERDEEIELKVAAVVTQILPNGNMVIHGKQQVRVSNERRDLEVAGIIRPEDITINNSISYEKIAEARIAYGGQGMITDANRPRYGNEVMDILLPF